MNAKKFFGMVYIAALLTILPAGNGYGTTFEVGPGQAYANIGDVPWESAGAGDEVLIHWRAAPYNEKWVIAIAGTAQAPFVVRGIFGPDGERPVIDGRNATTRPLRPDRLYPKRCVCLHRKRPKRDH
jgi:hypothetical protein